MKRIVAVVGVLFFLMDSSAMTPNCDTTVQPPDAFNDAALLYSAPYEFWYPAVEEYRKIKFCSFSPDSAIVTYTGNEFLIDKNSGLGGETYLFDAFPQIINGVGTVTISSPDSIYPAENPLRSPQEKYLKGSGNQGFFRFYTKTITRSCASDYWGYKFIERYLDKKNIKANGKPLEKIGEETNITLTGPSSSKVEATVSLEESERNQFGANGFTQLKICTIDVYAKIKLKPTESTNFNKSGIYTLSFTVN